MEDLISQIYKVAEDENYWLFRAGQEAVHFDTFYHSKKIGMAWDRIDSIEQITSEHLLKEIVKNKYPEEEKPGNISSKIYQFAKKMKKGDIVIMPDEKKVRVAFGRVADDEIEVKKAVDQLSLFKISKENDENRTDPGYLNKYRKVEWIKILAKEELSAKLLLHLFSPHTISKLHSEVKYEVNKLMFDKFIINDKIYLKYKVNTDNDILASDIKTFFDLIGYAEKMIKVLDENENIVTKISVASKGDIVAIATAGTVLLIVIGYIVNGGELTLKTKNIDLSWKQGRTLYDYLEQNHRHELESEKLEKIKELEKEFNKNISSKDIDTMQKNLEIKNPNEE